jgi:BatD DUF11 like domain
MVIRAFCLLLGLFLSVTVFAANVAVQVEPASPSVGESFRIAFTAQGEIKAEPDFTPLEPLLEILSRNRQTSIQWINGKHTRTTIWVLEVIAKTTGDLVLPSLKFGQSVTAPQTIKMRDTEAANSDEGLFLEVDASPKNPYVQQQVLYTIRLWRRFELSNASLSEPRVSGDAIIRPLGEDRHLSMERNGKAYEVIERRFVIFPQVSGALEISPSTVTAQVVTRGFSLFDMFGQSVKTRRVTSEKIALKVRPVPKSFPVDASWLPASKVRISEVWEPTNMTVPVGEPATRTLSVWAENLTSAQLPTLTPELPPSLNTYPDQPYLKDDATNDALTALRQEKIALIPTTAGAIEIPPIELPWWNTITDALEIARIPGQDLTATLSANVAQPPPRPAKELAGMPPERKLPISVPMSPSTSLLEWSGWFWIALISFSGWLYCLWSLRSRRAGVVTGTSNTDPGSTSLRAATAEVTRACRQNDPQATKHALLQWGKHKWPDRTPTSLGAIANQSPAALAEALLSLDEALYRQSPAPWSGAALSEAFSADFSQRAASPKPMNELPPLFKLAPE